MSIAITFKNESDAELSTNAFDGGTLWQWRIGTWLVPNLPRTSINAGPLPYFAFSVFYDADHSHRLAARGPTLSASKREVDRVS